MNKSEREYAVSRVNRISYRKRDEITTKYKLTDKEKLVLLRSGEVKLKKKLTRLTINDLYDFSKFMPKGDMDKELAAMEAECRKIKDRLYLGDAGDALALIREFEK